MAKYTASIDEGTRQRIHALPGRVHFPAFMRKAISIFVEELEKDAEGKNRKVSLDTLISRSIFQNTYALLEDSGNWYMWEEKGIVEG